MRGCTSLGQLEDGVRSGVMAEIRSAQKATGHNPTGVALAGLREGAARSGERARREPVRERAGLAGGMTGCSPAQSVGCKRQPREHIGTEDVSPDRPRKVWT